MNEVSESSIALRAREIRKSFLRESGEKVTALDGVSLEVAHGSLTALVGPDGAGKTTLIRLATGLMTADSGELTVLGIDVSAEPQQVQDRIGYMPQKFGLYEDLSVQENLDLYADLHGVSFKERSERYPRLMEMTALGPFTSRLAGRLSGGMKQKLGLACTLVRAPDLLILDEPTVGVDPLSRRELWQIIFQLVNDQRLTVLLSTSYLDEAERCGRVVVLHHGGVLAQGQPSDISRLAAGRTYLVEPPAGQKTGGFQARLLNHPAILDAVPQGGRVRFVTQNDNGRIDDAATNDSPLAGTTISPVPPRFEDGFMILLRQSTDKDKRGQADSERSMAPRLPVSLSANFQGGEAAIQVRDLVRRFGTFTAVDHITFEVRRDEIFDLLDPNGTDKTTTFRMLYGLLPASAGTLRIAG